MIIDSERVWYASMWQDIVLIACTIILVNILLNKANYFSKNENLFFSYIVLLYALLNFISSFPMIFRYYPILFYFIFSLAIIFYSKFENKMISPIILLSSPAILLLYAIQLRILLDFSNYLLFTSNFPIQVLIDNNTSFLNLFGY